MHKEWNLDMPCLVGTLRCAPETRHLPVRVKSFERASIPWSQSFGRCAFLSDEQNSTCDGTYHMTRLVAGAGAVNDETWEEVVLKSSVPVLVDFWAPWCGPCRMIAPIIDEIAQEYGDKLKAVKLNTDESPQVATEYGIRSIPTVMVFKDGQKMDAVIGAVPKSTLVQTIEKYMS
jgi:thioredoxin 1